MLMSFLLLLLLRRRRRRRQVRRLQHAAVSMGPPNLYLVQISLFLLANRLCCEYVGSSNDSTIRGLAAMLGTTVASGSTSGAVCSILFLQQKWYVCTVLLIRMDTFLISFLFCFDSSRGYTSVCCTSNNYGELLSFSSLL
jgi:hypothetical protein